MRYPIGTQSFEQLRKDGYVYVDKTELIHRLVTTGRIYFMSRPRRFGKSLLLSTLRNYFLGRRELSDLFIDLYDEINQRDYYYNENHNTNIDISSYPNDNVHINNASLIENIVINSISFVSTSSINTLFESYE